MKLLGVLLACFLWSPVQAQVITGDVFEQKSNFGKKLFSLDIKLEKQEGLLKTLALYKDLKGQSAVEEKSLLNGDALVSYEINQYQTKERGHIEVQGEKVLFTYEKNGQKKTSQENLSKPVLTTANFNFYVAHHWSEFASGKEVEVRFAVWDRLETVGFKIFKVGETQKGSEKLIHLRMKPSSFVIAALVDPLNLWYSEDGRRLMELSGRVVPKIQKGSDWKDLDADVRYVYPVF